MEEMNASEILRRNADDNWSAGVAGIAMALDAAECNGRVFELLANKIDAELAQARELSLLRGAELWAKANGWPDFRDGEDFGAWLDRCFLPRPRFEDGEPVQLGDRVLAWGEDHTVERIGIEVRGGGCLLLQYIDSPEERLERPASEVLGADGKPIVEGETVWDIDSEWLDTPLEVLSVESLSVKVSLPSGKGWTMFRADRLTHTPPDTLERLRDDIAEWRADCAKPGSGWDVKTAEWAARIDAIIRRTGGAE